MAEYDQGQISANVDISNSRRPKPVEKDDPTDFSDMSPVTSQPLMNIFKY